MSKYIVVTGPTGSGKTAVADAICEAAGGEIISADSRQVYKGLDVGTNLSPTRAPQHLVSFLSPEKTYSAAEFFEAASTAERDIAARGKLPVIAGGTGLYIKTLFDGGLDAMPSADYALRARMSGLSTAGIYEKLKSVDPVSADKNIGNPQRLLRALEVFELTGVPMSMRRDPARRGSRRARYCCAGLFMERNILRAGLSARARRMVSGGLIEETRRVLREGHPRSCPAFSGIGYRAVFDFIDGKIDSETLIERIAVDTIKYAKRQATWFRTQTPPDKWYDASQPAAVTASQILSDAANSGK